MENLLDCEAWIEENLLRMQFSKHRRINDFSRTTFSYFDLLTSNLELKTNFLSGWRFLRSFENIHQKICYKIYEAFLCVKVASMKIRDFSYIGFASLFQFFHLPFEIISI